MIKAFVIAPTPLMQAGLQTLLSSPDIQVMGAASSIRSDSRYTNTLADADVLVLANRDLLDETTLSRALGDITSKRLGLVVLSEDNGVVGTLRALGLKGWGIVSPDAPAPELQTTVAAVAQGLIVMPPAVMERLLGQRPVVENLNLEPLDEPLTARESEVLELLGQGLSNKLIARQLNISEHTVKFHISSLYNKLGASSRTEAISYGARRGLITL